MKFIKEIQYRLLSFGKEEGRRGYRFKKIINLQH